VLKLLADENLRSSIIRGLRRRRPDADLLRIQDVGLSGADDPTVLALAAEPGRALLTHDVNTVPGHAWRRVDDGLSMPGVLAVPERFPVGRVIESLVLLIESGEAADWDRQVVFLPL
jgi:hypothetical protein